MSRQTKANLSLLLVAMFWGSSCILTKVGLENIQEYNLIALRFIIAFLATLPIFWNRHIFKDKQVIQKAALLGFVLFVVLALMSFGVDYTSASNAGFLTCLAGIFIPFFNFFFLKQKIEGKIYLCVAIALAGMALLTVRGSIALNIGDVLCILCSLAFAVHIILTNRFAQDVDPISLSILQLGFVGLYSLVMTFAVETPHVPTNAHGWLVVLALSLLCSAFAFFIQTVAQKYTSSVYTGLIYSLEPAFAAIFAFAFLGEVLTGKGYMGAALLFLSLILMEIDFQKIKQR